MLSEKAPNAFFAVQTLLIAVYDFIHSKVQPAEKELKNVMEAYSKFVMHLRTERFPISETDTYGCKYIAIKYLDEFSSVFPNWQDIYSCLNWFIWECME